MDEKAKGEKKQSVSEREAAVLEYWKEHRIFEKSVQKNEGKDRYVFYDGPPFATGLPHHGHLLQGTIKDVIPRYQTMRGRHVRREWGWDCHGLPIENLIEKELGLKQKSEIEEYGVERFNQKARESVLMYDKEWRSIVPRMGRWVDMDHEYKTMDASYTESVWWAFKTLHDKKLIYEGFKSMHICPRCETTLAASEVAQGYKDIKDISVYVKFELKDEPGTFLVAWTTTPWTLPGNVAIAVNPEFVYVIVAHEGARYIVAKELCAKIFKDKVHEVVDEKKGKDLIGKAYKPLFDYYTSDEKLEHRENAWKVVGADFVTVDSGTGIVHEAPAFGEEDMELAKKLKLPMIQHVGMNGQMKHEVKDFAGMSVKPKSDDDKVRLATDIAVLKYLQEHGTFFAKENITHSYPHCWRCDTPLLNYAASSWFVNVTTLKPRLIEENKEIKWIPESVRDGRFGHWLEGARDWAISRSRYWGAPLPVWKCNKCGKVDAHGSVASLSEKTKSTNNYFVMRHGESEANIKGIVSYKIEDEFHLTENGRAQVAATAAKLKDKGIDMIIASPVLRTKETARIVASELGIPESAVIFDERLAEVNTGDFNGCAIDTYRAYFTSTLEKFTKPSPGGENLRQMFVRVASALYDANQKYEGKTILFVTHEYGTWMLDAAAKGATDDDAAWMRVEGGDDYYDYAEALPFAFAPLPHNDRYELDFHRPYIDRVSYRCSCELGTMERIPEVFDCWFESGSMPYAQFHYMGDETTPDGKLFVKNFPADFIAEAQDQTRGWFYTMLILSVGLFDRAAFKSVITTGLILAEDGQKMSKKLKNYPDPMEITSKFGADALRFYMLNSPVVRGEELRFATLGVDEVFKKLTLRLENIHAFYALHANNFAIPRTALASPYALDRWILSRLSETHAEVTHHLDTHELDRATRPILPFLDDWSTWYIRRSRDRFKSEDAADRDAAIATTGWVLLQFAKLIAPFMPFTAEDLYLQLSVEDKKESIHLEDWPPMSVGLTTVLEEMEEVRTLVSLALEERAKAGIKVRQPLATLSVIAPKLEGKTELLDIIKDEVNVKQVVIVRKLDTEATRVALDTEITPELKEEGEVRDFIRAIQDLRKKAGLEPADRITLSLTPDLAKLYAAHKDEINQVVGATSHAVGEAVDIVKT